MTREPGTRLSPEEIGALAQLACTLEVCAPKPGNVSAGRPFRDVAVEDFFLSAAAIGPVLAGAGRRGLGTTIRSAVEATGRVTRANTNLGIVLLLAPLARAALLEEPGALRSRLSSVLATTTVGDAEQAYHAIRRARPGGLGSSGAEDVANPPTVTLRQAMQLAADRDTVAREYVTDFSVTFETGLPALQAARREGLSWSEGATECFLRLLARIPDSLIARKLGAAAAEAISVTAGEIEAKGGVRTPAGRDALEKFDAGLRDPQNTRNPGTTADLTAAALFLALLERGGPGAIEESFRAQ